MPMLGIIVKLRLEPTLMLCVSTLLWVARARRPGLAVVLATAVSVGCGHSSGVDGDATALCGNAVVEGDESCDGTNVGWLGCWGLGYYGGELGCLPDCTFDVTDCELYGWCGDGVINGGEVCDGEVPLGTTCESLGYVGGELRCVDGCWLFDYDCFDVCGDGQLTGDESCDDGNSDPYDGCNECELAELRASEPSLASQTSPAVALSDDGTFVVAWRQVASGGVVQRIKVRRFTADDQSQGPSLYVNMDTSGTVTGPRVAMDATGGFVVAWQAETGDGSGFDIMARFYDELGDPLDGPVRVNAVRAGDQTHPGLARLQTGQTLIVWQSVQDGGDGLDIYGRFFDTNGQPLGSDFLVNVETSGDQEQPTAAGYVNGYCVVWRSDDHAMLGQVLLPSGNPLGPPLVMHEPGLNASERHRPDVSMDHWGFIGAVWENLSPFGDHIGARRYELPDYWI